MCTLSTDEMYQLVSFLPEEVQYTCRVCSTDSPPYWERVLKSELVNGLLNVLSSLMSSKCAQLLLESGPPVSIVGFLVWYVPSVFVCCARCSRSWSRFLLWWIQQIVDPKKIVNSCDGSSRLWTPMEDPTNSGLLWWFQQTVDLCG